MEYNYVYEIIWECEDYSDSQRTLIELPFDNIGSAVRRFRKIFPFLHASSLFPYDIISVTRKFKIERLSK